MNASLSLQLAKYKHMGDIGTCGFLNVSWILIRDRNRYKSCFLKFCITRRLLMDKKPLETYYIPQNHYIYIYIFNNLQKRKLV